jgi:hypothetical protein
MTPPADPGLRETLLARLRQGTHWLLLVSADDDWIIGLVLRTLDATLPRGRPKVPVDLWDLDLHEVDAAAQETRLGRVLLLSWPRPTMPATRLAATLTQAYGVPCTAADVERGAIVTPVRHDQLMPAGERLRVFETWLTDGDCQEEPYA